MLYQMNESSRQETGAALQILQLVEPNRVGSSKTSFFFQVPGLEILNFLVSKPHSNLAKVIKNLGKS